MKIKFHSTLYELYSEPFTSNDRLNVCIIMGENDSFDFLINEDSLNTKDITVYEDDGVTIRSVYSGFNSRVAISIIDGAGYISIEFKNSFIEDQIAALTEQLNTKVDSSVLSKSAEEIGQPSKKPYNEGETFEAGGKLYKALCYISVGNVLVEDGNCKTISIEELTKEETQ